MSLTSYDGRSLPSVFSDIPSRGEVQEARRRIGSMGMWIFFLIGVAVLALAVAGASFYYYNQQREAIEVLRDANGRLQADSTAYRGLTELRERVLTERRALLDILEARTLSPRQRELGWMAARRSCAGPANALRCFEGQPNWTRERNEPSQNWPALLEHSNTVLQYELDALAIAKREARQAQLSVGGPTLPEPICDPVTKICTRPSR